MCFFAQWDSLRKPSLPWWPKRQRDFSCGECPAGHQQLPNRHLSSRFFHNFFVLTVSHSHSLFAGGVLGLGPTHSRVCNPSCHEVFLPTLLSQNQVWLAFPPFSVSSLLLNQSLHSSKTRFLCALAPGDPPSSQRLLSFFWGNQNCQ